MTPETNCYDGIDNDSNGLTDCLDPACLHKHCTSGATSASVCCGTGTNATVCKNLGADPANCGGCGVTCASGTCTAANNGGFYSGRCSCPSGSAQCPLGFDSYQGCVSGLCSCETDFAKCRNNISCAQVVCHY